MRKKLYWTIQKFSLRYACFVFFDTTPYLADQLFIRHKVQVWFEREYTKKDAPDVAGTENFRRFQKQRPKEAGKSHDSWHW